MSVDELKMTLDQKLSVPKYQQRLMFKGRALSGKYENCVLLEYQILYVDSQKLSHYSLTDGTKIHLSINKNAEPPVIESKLNKELKQIAANYVKDVDKFTILFNKVNLFKTKIFII